MKSVISGRYFTRSAFSLVELSIVLVILGLLVGGVLSGQSLIRASEMRSIVTQHDQIYAAVKSFRDKYFGLPGDITNATQFWGAAAAPGACSATASTTTTCNGNGDGKIGFAGNPGEADEPFRFWQQLADAGLIEGSYNGYDASRKMTKANSPSGKISSTLWGVEYKGAVVASDGQYFNGNYGNVFYYGGAR